MEARTLSQILASCWRFGDAHPPFIAESNEPTWNQHYSKLIMIPIILSGAIFHGEEKNAHYQRTRRRAVYALTSLPPLTLKLVLPHQRLSQRHIAWDTCALGHSPPIMKISLRTSHYHLRQQTRRWNHSSSIISCTINLDSNLTQLGKIYLSISLFWRLKFWTRNSSDIIIIFDKLYQYSPKSSISTLQKRKKRSFNSTSNR